MARWLPLADALLEMIVEQLPSPQAAQSERMKRLLPEAATAAAAATTHAAAATHADGGGSGSAERVLAGEASMRRCDASASEVMAFVSKMFAADPLPRDTQRRFIGFTRVFAGTLRVGDTIMVLGPRHEPPAGCADSAGGAEGGEAASAHGMRHASRAVVQSLHLMMGRDLLDVSCVPAGCICGIGGLESHILKYATLCTSVYCRPMHLLSFQAQPIVCVAVEPVNPHHYDTLVHGLQLLNKADPCVETRSNDKGELVVLAAGEMHLEMCLKDLRELFAKVDIHVSPPLVQFKESLAYLTPDAEDVDGGGGGGGVGGAGGGHRGKDDAVVPVVASTQSKLCEMSFRAEALPPLVLKALKTHEEAYVAGHADLMARTKP